MFNIIVSTFTLSPTKGSEFSVGWNYINNMAIDNRLFVLYGTCTGEFGSFEDLSIHLRDEVKDNIVFFPVKTKNTLFLKVCYFMKQKGIKIIPYYFIYRNWHKEAYKEALKILNVENIDVIHYLNPIGFKEPGYSWKIDKPYIWGPVQGIHKRPYYLTNFLNIKNKLIFIIRNVLLKVILQYSFRVKQAMKISDLVISATTQSQFQFYKYFNINSIYIPENGITCIETNTPIHKHYDDKLKLIWIGNLCTRKALNILLHSLSLYLKDNSKWELNIVGTGNKKRILKKYAIKKGIDNNIKWHGQKSRAEVQNIINNCHIHIITSLGEGNPTTIWETMSKGIPTLTRDHCGMHDTICKNCGIKIPIKHYNQVIFDISKKIKSLIDNL